LCFRREERSRPRIPSESAEDRHRSRPLASRLCPYSVGPWKARRPLIASGRPTNRPELGNLNQRFHPTFARPRAQACTVALARMFNWDTTMMQILSVLHAPYISAMVRRVVIPITDSRQSPVYVESICKYLIGSNYAKEFAYRLVAQPLAEKEEKKGKRGAETGSKQQSHLDGHARVPLLGVLATSGMPSLLLGRKTT
jgi:hypothetical protein